MHLFSFALCVCVCVGGGEVFEAQWNVMIINFKKKKGKKKTERKKKKNRRRKQQYHYQYIDQDSLVKQVFFSIKSDFSVQS